MDYYNIIFVKVKVLIYVLYKNFVVKFMIIVSHDISMISMIHIIYPYSDVIMERTVLSKDDVIKNNVIYDAISNFIHSRTQSICHS